MTRLNDIKVGDKVDIYPNIPHLRRGRPPTGYVTKIQIEYGDAVGVWVDDGADYSWLRFSDVRVIKPYTVEEWTID